MTDYHDIADFGPEGLKLSRKLTSWKFLFGRWLILPSLGFWGVRVESIDKEKCEVSIPFSWRTKNPFRSTYFAALQGAAELSTGALLQCHLADKGPWSMLVVHVEMDFVKKATSTVRFSCDQGSLISQNINKALELKQPVSFILKSVGCDDSGDPCCTAKINWSIKKR